MTSVYLDDWVPDNDLAKNFCNFSLHLCIISLTTFQPFWKITKNIVTDVWNSLLSKQTINLKMFLFCLFVCLFVCLFCILLFCFCFCFCLVYFIIFFCSVLFCFSFWCLIIVLKQGTNNNVKSKVQRQVSWKYRTVCVLLEEKMISLVFYIIIWFVKYKMHMCMVQPSTEVPPWIKALWENKNFYWPLIASQSNTQAI